MWIKFGQGGVTKDKIMKQLKGVFTSYIMC
jgi:hypothetical protein